MTVKKVSTKPIENEYRVMNEPVLRKGFDAMTVGIRPNRTTVPSREGIASVQHPGTL